MTIAKRLGFLTLIYVLGLADSAAAGEQSPWFGCWAAGKCQDGMSCVHNACEDAKAFAVPLDRRRLEELARDAYFSCLEFQESFVGSQPQADAILAGEDAKFFYDRGRKRAERGEYDQAISDFNASLRLAPNNATYYFARGCVWGEKREYLRAIRDLDRCIRIEPRAGEAYHVRGMYRLTLGDPDRALADFDDFVRLDASARAHFCRALVWIGKRESANAKRDLAQAVRLDPDNAMLYVVQGGVRLWTYDDNGGIAAFDRALELSPDLAAALAGRALAFGRKGLRHKAAEDAARAGELEPTLARMKQALPGWPVHLYVKGNGTSFQYSCWTQRPVATDRAADGQTAAAHPDPLGQPDPLTTFRRAIGFPKSFSGDQSPLDPRRNAPGHQVNPAGAADHTRASGATSASESIDRRSISFSNRQRADELNTTAWTLATARHAILRNGAAAIAAAREACELTYWNDAACLDTLAAAYAESGDFESAIRFQNDALRLWPATLDGRQRYEARLKLYQARQPYREEPAGSAFGASARSHLSDDERRAKDFNDQAWHWATARYAVHRDGVKAVEAARQACELAHWRNSAYLATLAAAYAECGDFESADKYQAAVVELWPPGIGRDAAERRHALFRARQPVSAGE